MQSELLRENKMTQKSFFSSTWTACDMSPWLCTSWTESLVQPSTASVLLISMGRRKRNCIDVMFFSHAKVVDRGGMNFGWTVAGTKDVKYTWPNLFIGSILL
jgi:hypothetical protein